MRCAITLTSPIRETPRVQQVRGLFDLLPAADSRSTWTADLPVEQRPWNVGLLTGPSGCGKSTIARKLWPAQYKAFDLSAHGWAAEASILDGFPEGMSVKLITELLSSVGFSAPPAWLRPYAHLSTGQQFRVDIAHALAHALAQSPHPLVVLDEFTSVVDRTVARIGSAAIARTVRNHKLQFVAVTCHEDVIDWLQPDWVYEPAEGRFTWRLLQRRPAIRLHLVRCQASAWPLFAPHHYLSHTLNPSAICFLASWQGRPVAFSSWLPFFGGGKPARREHRTVVLPDYQGVGIGMAVSSTIASMWTVLGYRALSTTTHPAFIASRQRSPHWRMHRAPSLAARQEKGMQRATTRLTAGFEYVGPPMNPHSAELLHAE